MYKNRLFFYIQAIECTKNHPFYTLSAVDAQNDEISLHCQPSMYKMTSFLCIVSPRCTKIGFFFTSKALNAQKALAGGHQTAHLIPLNQNKHRILVVFLRFDADEVSAVCRDEARQEGIPLFKREVVRRIGELEIFLFARLLVLSNQIGFPVPAGSQI